MNLMREMWYAEEVECNRVKWLSKRMWRKLVRQVLC